MYVEFNTTTNGKIRPFEGDYLLWSDTMIQVKVPSTGLETQASDPFNPMVIDDSNSDNACTGTIRLCVDGMMSCGTSAESAEVITIRYSARNGVHTPSTSPRRSVPAVLLNWIDGGYLIQNHPSIDTVPKAKTAFVRALNNWRCTTGFNADYPDTLLSFATNGGCYIQFSNLPIGTQSATRASTNALPESCNDVDFYSLEGFIIRFNRNVDWHYDLNSPSINWIEFDAMGNISVVRGDFESTALHELGHAHLLLHTCNQPSTNLMYSPGPNDYRRIITTDAELGGHHIMNLSGGVTDSSCPKDGIVKVLPQDCELVLTSVGNYRYLDKITLYPNPTHSRLFVEGVENITGSTQFEIYNVLGERMGIYDRATVDNGLGVGMLPPGVYVLVAIGQENYILGQFVIQ